MSDPSILPVRPLRRAEYDRMVDLRMFRHERIELIDGLLVQMSRQGAPHAHALRLLTGLFVRALGDRALVQAPDIAVRVGELVPLA